MERYLCPNDRQLALRARLGTGWSSRSQIVPSQPGSKLTNVEEEQILDVLRRNEKLLNREKQRITQMLDRLARMRQESTPHSRNECALCKQEFKILSRLPLVCSECGRHVCAECSAEEHLPSKNHQPASNWVSMISPMRNVTSWSRKNTVSLDRTDLALCKNESICSEDGPLETRRIGDVASDLVQSSHKFINKLRSRRSSLDSESHNILCHLCREAIDVWKRSGGWFYNAIPKYQNDSNQDSSIDATKRKMFTSLKDLVEPVSAPPEEEGETSWIKLTPRRRFSQADANQLEGQSEKRKVSISQMVAEKQHARLRGECTKDVLDLYSKPAVQRSVHKNGDAMRSNILRKQSDNLTQSSESLFTNDQSKTSDKIQHVTSTCTTPSTTSQQAEPTPISWPGIQHPVFGTSRSSSSSTATALASSLGFNNQSRKVASITGEDTSVNTFASNKSESALRKARASGEGAPFGLLYYTLYHDTVNKQLHVAIHKAKNLIAMDANGLSDPYVVCEIVPSSHNSPRPRTSTRPQCLNPVWNEALTFEPVEAKNIHSKTLRFAVLDEDLYGSDWLGEYWQPLGSLAPDRLTDFTVALGPRRALHKGEHDLACPSRGKIQLGLRYHDDRCQLCVEVIRCSDLAPMDPNGLSDPFVKLYLLPDKAKKTKQKTKVIKANLFPEFNEKFYYNIRASEASYRTLEVTVWDFDRGPSNDFIGGLTLGANAKAERRELWLAVFRPPFRRIEAWFQLSRRSETEVDSSTPGICD